MAVLILALRTLGALGLLVLIPLGFLLPVYKRIDPDGAGKELESDESFWG